MPDDIGQLPTQLDPQRSAALQSLFPQNPQANAGAPTVAGAQPPQSPDIMSEMVQASREGRGMATAETGKVSGLGSQIENLVQQQQQTPIPKTGFLDTQGQPQQGGFLHNLGRALIAVGTATRPGAAVQEAYYSPGMRRYEAETGARAKEIEQLRGQQEEHEKLAGVGAGMVSKPITAAGAAMRGEAAVDRAKAYVDTVVPTQAKAALANIDLKKAALDQKTRNDAAKVIQAKVDEAGRNFRAQNKNATEEEVAAVLAGSREAIKNAAIAANPSAWQQIQVALGWGDTPQIQGGPQVQQTPPKPAAKPTAKPTAKAQQIQEGATATGPNGHKIKYSGGKWVDAATGKPIQ